MIEIHARIGDLFLEEAPEINGPIKLNLYDSTQKYMYSFSTENIDKNCSLEGYICCILNRLLALQSVEELLKFIQLKSWTLSEKWEDLLEDMYGLENIDYDKENERFILLTDNTEITEKRVLDDPAVYKIGFGYVYNCDY